jgi:hypothetical protein
MHKVAQGVTVTADRLAVEAIANVMAGENFLEQAHTLKYLRSGEMYRPRLGFDGLWSEFVGGGSKDIRTRARAFVNKGIRVHGSWFTVECLPCKANGDAGFTVRRPWRYKLTRTVLPFYWIRSRTRFFPGTKTCRVLK